MFVERFCTLRACRVMRVTIITKAQIHTKEYIMQRTRKRHIVFFMTLVLVISLNVVTLQSAVAGSNGQQIQVQLRTPGLPDQIVRLVVKGTNNAGNYVVFNSWPYSNPAGTAGWWWKGLVGIEATNNRTGITSKCIAQSIPQTQASNWVYITINPEANTCTCSAQNCACWCR